MIKGANMSRMNGVASVGGKNILGFAVEPYRLQTGLVVHFPYAKAVTNR